MKYKDKIVELFNEYTQKNSDPITIYYDYRDIENVESFLYITKKSQYGYDKKVLLTNEYDIIDNIYNLYLDSESYYIKDYIKCFIQTLSYQLQFYYNYHEYEINNDLVDIFYDHVGFDYHDIFNSILNSEININMIWNKNDGGYDYLSFIKMLLHKQGHLLKNHIWIKQLINEKKLSKKASIQLKKDKKDIFLKSLYDEILESYLDSPLDYTIIARVTIENYFKLIDEKQKHKIKINKNCISGFVDFYNGGGSILDIQLKKDMVFNNHDFRIKVEKINRYTVDEIYGLTRGCFKNCVTL